MSAYGLFWDRSQVGWPSGKGRAWQLLGYRGANTGTVRVCDFRRARGLYILYNDYGPNYVGIARGTQGIGQRLLTHDRVRTDRHTAWTRFSWFSFDHVVDVGSTGWAALRLRAALKEVDAEAVVFDMEALMIKVLGTAVQSGQNDMNFNRGRDVKQWEQVTSEDIYPGRPLQKVDPTQLTDWMFRDYLEQLEDRPL
ncbi:hypothetical protein HJ588_01760 [Flexivirga sp. ID2601S]|uniref:Uncharacterized protein n=1 Tax=Flexivirga aerilata TaxID=1656889 RepID=A0A849ADZ7_9MICO|nr:hypothetical protein [Flexivirga aerilata]NNG38003.1 hypothetical protein [Flexivirga aerilata]